MPVFFFDSCEILTMLLVEFLRFYTRTGLQDVEAWLLFRLHLCSGCLDRDHRVNSAVTSLKQSK